MSSRRTPARSREIPPASPPALRIARKPGTGGSDQLVAVDRILVELRGDGQFAFYAILPCANGPPTNIRYANAAGTRASSCDVGPPASERFAELWTGGETDLPLGPCTSEQLHRAARAWGEREGVRIPASQGAFSAQVKRWAQAQAGYARDGRPLAPVLGYRIVRGGSANSGRRGTARAWLPRGMGPHGDESVGTWAAAWIARFEQRLGASAGAGVAASVAASTKAPAPPKPARTRRPVTRGS